MNPGRAGPGLSLVTSVYAAQARPRERANADNFIGWICHKFSEDMMQARWRMEVMVKTIWVRLRVVSGLCDLRGMKL